MDSATKFDEWATEEYHRWLLNDERLYNELQDYLKISEDSRELAERIGDLLIFVMDEIGIDDPDKVDTTSIAETEYNEYHQGDKK